MKPYSLRRRLLLWLLIATVTLGLIALLDTWREALRTAQSLSDRVLIGSALAIAERVTVDESGGLEVDIPYSSLEMLTSTAQDKVFYRVDGPVGRYLTGYENLEAVATQAGGVGFADGVYGTVGIRTATLIREISTGATSIPFAVTVAESTRARTALARAILWRSAMRLVMLILGVSALVWIAITVALRPLERLGDVISLRSPDDLRPVTADTPIEVEPLVAAINSFMQRLETALGALRNFTGNASHQLRTPLAVVRTQLALMDRRTDPADAAAARDKARVALERAERVLAQLLVLARVDASTGAGILHPVDIAAVAKDVTVEMVPMALQHQVDLGFEGLDAAQAVADPVLLAELLKNIVANAVSYAGRGAVVTVRVVREDGGLVLEVEDDGPGLPAEQQLFVNRRTSSSTRPLPALARSQTSGMGLGLAIAAEISALFDARLSLEPGRSGSGLLARVFFTEDTG
jgi:two-component system sensor histidine kinase TctE